MKVIVKQYNNMEDAQAGVAALHAMGIKNEQIGFLTRRGTSGNFEVPSEMNPDDVSATEGALFGGFAGLVAAVVAMATPFGPIVAAGPLFGALVGTLAGAATGGAVASLVENHNVDRETAERLAALLESESAVLLSVEVPAEEMDEVHAQLANAEALQGESQRSYEAQAVTTGVAPQTDSESYQAAYQWGYRAATHTTRTFDEVEADLRDRYPGPYARDRDAIREGFSRHRKTIIRV